MAKVQQPRVTARPLGVLRADFRKQLVDRFRILDITSDQPACMHVASLCLGNDRLRVAAQLFRLLRGRFYPAVEEQRRCHIAQHRFAMLGGAAEAATFLAMSHPYSSRVASALSSAAAPSRDLSSMRNNSPSSPSSIFIPKCKLCSFRNWRISSRDLMPKFSMLSICSSER